MNKLFTKEEYEEAAKVSSTIVELSILLKCKPENIVETIQRINHEITDLQKEKAHLQNELAD